MGTSFGIGEDLHLVGRKNDPTYGQKRGRPPKKYKIPRRPAYRQLLVAPGHASLQKVRVKMIFD